MEIEQTCTVREAAARLKLCDQTVRRHLAAGKLSGMKIGRVWRIAESDFIDFLERHKRTGGNKE